MRHDASVQARSAAHRSFQSECRPRHRLGRTIGECAPLGVASPRGAGEVAGRLYRFAQADQAFAFRMRF
jgi:hypothetical protein